MACFAGEHIINFLTNGHGGMADTSSSAASKVVDRVLGTAQRAFDSVSGAASDAIDAAASKISPGIQRLKAALGELRSQSGQAGKTPSGWLNRGRSEANSARVFSSADDHVADAANAIERAMPGRVKDTNANVTMSNGLPREVDIDLGNIVVQVKSGNARGLTGQIIDTASTTGRATVGYAPGIPNAAWLNAARQGIPIARTPDELISIIKELS